MEYDRYSTTSSDGGKKIVTKSTTVMPYDPNSGVLPPPGTQEEWTTTKRKINHKTKQVETRVQRQIVMEDGKVIADSGPQVTTKTTEDHKSDESEDVKHRKLGESEVPEEYRKNIGNQVVFEKNTTHNVMRDAKEENYQYHDESLRELDGKDIHKRAKENPNELLSKIDNEIPKIPRGKLVHYSSKGRKVNDVDNIQEVSRLDKDGQLKTETTQTQHHEEYEDDEVPEEEETKHIEGTKHNKQLEYNRHEYDDRRTNSSMSLPRSERHKASKNYDDDVETSEVYRISDKMRSLKTNKKNRSTYKDDASTQASLSDNDDALGGGGGDNDNDDRRRRRTSGRHEVHERIESKKSTFGSPGSCCDGLNKNKYYYGDDSGHRHNHRDNHDDKGYISSHVKTSKFAMENDKVIEDTNFNEDFERSFKDKNEKREVHRDYDRFVERTKEHTKNYDRSISPSSMLPPPHPSSEYSHRPAMTSSNHDLDKQQPSRSRSFYDHQVHEYESHRSHRNQNNQNNNNNIPTYSTLPTKVGGDRYRSPSPSASWNPSAQQYSHYPINDRRPSFTRSSSRSEFPDFAPLSSPLEIKSLTENKSIKSTTNRHVSTYH